MEFTRARLFTHIELGFFKVEIPKLTVGRRSGDMFTLVVPRRTCCAYSPAHSEFESAFDYIHLGDSPYAKSVVSSTHPESIVPVD